MQMPENSTKRPLDSGTPPLDRPKRIKLGLRAKSALALGFAVTIVLVLAMLAGWRTLHSIEASLGKAYARNAAQFHKQRMLTPVLRELTLSQRFADSELLQRWLLDEDNPQKKALFFSEALSLIMPILLRLVLHATITTMNLTAPHPTSPAPDCNATHPKMAGFSAP
jgi:hypothetical protein